MDFSLMYCVRATDLIQHHVPSSLNHSRRATNLFVGRVFFVKLTPIGGVDSGVSVLVICHLSLRRENRHLYKLTTSERLINILIFVVFFLFTVMKQHFLIK